MMFSFNSVANNFDEHISKSIESYNTLSKNVISLADFFVVNNTNIVDIGSSTGKLLHSLKHLTSNFYDMVDMSNTIKE